METHSSGKLPINLRELPTDVLEILVGKAQDILKERNQDECAKPRTAAQLVEIFSGFGYETNGHKVWRVKWGDYKGCYGLQIGSYIHSCHIETTSFIVLLVYTEFHIRVAQLGEDDLEGPITLP